MATSEVTLIELSPKSVWGANASLDKLGEHYIPLPEKDQDGVITAHAVQTILAEPVALYELWRDISLVPRWQEHVISVSPVDANVSHWVMGDPDDEDGNQVEFDSRLIADVPGVSLSWQSITGDVDLAGAVTFTASPVGRGTVVTLVQTMKAPGAAMGAAVAGVARRSPKQTVIEDLRHFKQLAETGEIPSVKGQPHGPRGLSGGVKEWLYGENNPTPPGTSDKA